LSQSYNNTGSRAGVAASEPLAAGTIADPNMVSSASPAMSVVTVCRNAGETIARAAQSLVDQTFRDFEWVVVDGLSTDGTVAVAERFAAKLRASGLSAECRSEADSGIYAALNAGIARARGEVIGILNADDYYEPTTLARIADAHRTHPDAGIIYGFLRVVGDGGEFQVYRYNYDYILTHVNHPAESAAQHPTCFVLKTVYDTIGVFDTSYATSADYEFLLRAKRLGVRFHALDGVLSNFSVGGASWRISNSARIEQRYRAQYSNGLLTDAEYRLKQRSVARSRFGEWRAWLLHRFTSVLLGPNG